jgi:adenylate cyclase
MLIIAFFAMVGVLGPNTLKPQENRLLDFMIRFQAQSLEPDSEIVIIDIDERSLEEMARHHGRWPWPRAIHAELIEGLRQYEPSAIVFDILFSDRDIIRSNSDDYFVETVTRSPNVFLPIQLIATRQQANWHESGEILGFLKADQITDPNPKERWGLILPFHPLENTGRLGTINYSRDEDGIGRRYHIYQEAHGWKIPSLPAKVTKHLGYPLPTTQDIVLHWRGESLSYRRIPFFDLYKEFNSKEPSLDLGFLHNKIILIGATASALNDLRATPLDSLHPAIGILATAIDNIKNQRYLKAIHPAFILAITLLLISCQYIMAITIRNPLKEGLALFGASGLLLFTSFFALTKLYYLPLLTPIAIGFVYYSVTALQAHLAEKKAREKSVQMFSRFLDKRVVKQLVDGDESQILKSRTQDISIMFTDIRGFTSLSENRNAEQILTILNKYFEKQVQVIFQHGGTVDKFIGDAIMAFWGAPVTDENHAKNAVNAAMSMVDALQEFKKELNDPEVEFDIGIGIHSGSAVVGVVGFEQRMDYTCIGDTVNLASRIEGQTKGRARVLISAETKELCMQDFDYKDFGSIPVKGREKPVHLFEPMRRS